MRHPNCIGWFGPRCNFEPRYDEGAPAAGLKYEGSTTAEGVARVLQAARPVTYVCDVCTRCGEVSARPEQS